MMIGMHLQDPIPLVPGEVDARWAWLAGNLNRHYPLRWRFQLLSAALHILLAAVMALSGTIYTKSFLRQPGPKPFASLDVTPLIAPYLPPTKKTNKLKVQAKKVDTGKGGGGNTSPLPATSGQLPPVALRQFTPPQQQIANATPRLVLVEPPTLVFSEEIQLPKVLAQWGDPLERIGPPSNGPGNFGGIGTGTRGGIGASGGAGYGDDGNSSFGRGGGTGSAIIGTGVAPPRILRKVQPDYTVEAAEADISGVVELQVQIGTDGRAIVLRVLKSLGYGLDQKAIQAVRKWLFRPAEKDGVPIPIMGRVEVYFNR